MKGRFCLFLAGIMLITGLACKEKKKVADKRFFPVVSYLNSQVAQVDTSLNTIKKYIFIDSARTDTVYIPREQFRAAAQDFLTVPDLSTAEFAGRYDYSEQFDESLKRVLIVNTPVSPEKEIIQRQEVLIRPGDGSGDKVTNIVINTLTSSKDSTIEKKMLWRVDQSFTVTTIRQVAGQPEITSTYKVVWNEDE